VIKSIGRLFNSVILGISLMASVALYIALGSGLPRLREYFEMNELQFFDAWPLKVLMGLLVINLIVVTWVRIPLTPPRYGVWCVHLGIITLIIATSFYYHNKVEGLVRIPVGQSADFFYRGGDRAIYARVGGRLTAPWVVPSLPRFKNHTNPDTPAFQSRDLHGFAPAFLTIDNITAKPKFEGLAAELGVKELFCDVTGYWPYAELKTDYIADPLGESAGIALHLPDHVAWLIGTDPINHALNIGDIEFDHRIAGDATELNAIKQSAAHLHHLNVKVGAYSQSLDVEVGKTYTLGDSGYALKIENFDPAFPMSGTGEIAQVLTMLVSKTREGAKPQAAFRRMVLNGKALQTDFILNAPGAGPMGKRQKEPIDKDLTILYTLSDPFGLLPIQGREKHSILTAPTVPGVTEITASFDGPADINTIATDSGVIHLAGASASENGAPHAPIELKVERQDHLRREDHVVDVPSALRDRDTGQAGLFQIVRLRLSSGDWSQTVYVPYSQYVAEEDWNDAGSENGHTIAASRPIFVPGAKQPLEFRLGQEYDLLPAKITLDRFDAVPYDGAAKTGSNLMRDFKSTLTVEDRNTGEKFSDVAHMNHPVYFNSGTWLFFQAQWDPDGQRWSVLGIGNRPGVPVMVGGCIMIVIGLLYAFYAKPIIIRRMKRNALRRAGINGKAKPVRERAVSEVGV
ncbi:MAG: hypothetical protein JO353_12960, partial [Phycisphaerae bacterium]|nr:hypothetical protein [Phycisphaerae bacterium]